jgi:tRNA (cmo5U34)-methyltransferase
MLEAARARFVDQIERGQVAILEHDLRRGYPDGLEASVTLAVLSLQFVPIEYRQRIVRDIYRATRPGGVLVLVEKVLGDTAEIDETLVELYLQNKTRRGYSPEDIERKRLALEGVLVPVTAKWNVELLRAGGFTDVECVWRYLNFAAWLAIKG